MKTTNSWVSRAALLAIFGSMLLWMPPVIAQQPMVSDMLQRYGSSSATGEYEGTLYCIRCNFSPTRENLATCDKEGYEHFLLMKDGHVHPFVWDQQRNCRQDQFQRVTRETGEDPGQVLPRRQRHLGEPGRAGRAVRRHENCSA